MTNTAENTISALKLRFHAATDQELADRLSVGRSTVTSWKTRGKVPKRYQALAEDYSAEGGPLGWSLLSDLEKAGMQLAVLRIARNYREALADLGTFLVQGSSIPYELARTHSKACGDIRKIIDEEDAADITTALTVALVREFAAG